MTAITVLSKLYCHFSEDAKATVARLASELGFEVAVVDLSTTEGQQLAIGAGVLFPPGILMDAIPFSTLWKRHLRPTLVSLSCRAILCPTDVLTIRT